MGVKEKKSAAKKTPSNKPAVKRGVEAPAACDCGRQLHKFLGRWLCFACRNAALDQGRSIEKKSVAKAKAKGEGKGKGKGKGKSKSKSLDWTLQRLILAADKAAATGGPIVMPAADAEYGQRIVDAVSTANGGLSATPEMIREAAVKLASDEGLYFAQIASRPLKWVAERLAT